MITAGGRVRLRLRRLAILMCAVVVTLAGTTPSATASVEVFYPLNTWWNAQRLDNVTTGDLRQEEMAAAAGYGYVRREGWLLQSPPSPGTARLELFWNQARQDNASFATAAGIASAYSAGYVHIDTGGYVYTSQVPGTIPLYQFWSAARQDNVLAATPRTIDAARSAGYVLIRIEGYVIEKPLEP